MSDVEAAFERLPRDVTRERVSALGWPEDRLHFCASFVGACAGSSAAADDATKLYTPIVWRGLAQVHLHRAAAEADPDAAVAVLGSLGDAQRRDRFVRLTAQRALHACEARGANATDLRAALA
ncbi:MAG: hypothetical protein ACRDLN_07365 [Solirubrobacteraceae bacterium]